jgi:hypothetical protein
VNEWDGERVAWRTNGAANNQSKDRRPMSQPGEDFMKARRFFLGATVTTAWACASALPSPIISTPAAAQSNPTMTNVVPDGGNFATRGRIEAMDPIASMLTIVPDASPPVPMSIGPGVNLTNISVGDVASVHYTRSVTFVVGSPNAAVAQVPATTTVGQVAQIAGGIGAGAAVIVGRVVKLDDASSFDVINADGGGIYTVQTTNPARQAAIGMLKVGDSITVSISPIVATSVAKCGLFGKGLFGC